MKKSFSLFLMSLMLFMLVGCTLRSDIIERINEEVQSKEKFASVSISKMWDAVHGIYILKDGKKNIKVTLSFEGISKDTNLNNVIDSIVFISCTMYDSELGTYKFFFLFPDGSTKFVNEKELSDDFTLYDKWSWENSPRGIAIIPEKIILKGDKKRKADNSEWEIFYGNYDLSDEIDLSLRINSLKGSLILYYNVNDLEVVELYMDEFEEWSIIRKFWLKEDFKIDFEQVNFENLVNNFMYYYNKANFNKFLSNIS